MIAAILIMSSIVAPLAAYVGYLVGDRGGWKRGRRVGADAVCDSLIEMLVEPQYFTGASILYLLKRMKNGEVIP